MCERMGLDQFLVPSTALDPSSSTPAAMAQQLKLEMLPVARLGLWRSKRLLNLNLSDLLKRNPLQSTVMIKIHTRR